jgi:mRNA interferase RelE/StbE
MFDVVLSPEALDFYTNADAPLAGKLNRCFAQLKQNPRSHSNSKRLKGRLAGLWRYRVGDWRVVYRIDDEQDRVVILAIAHRREAYQ